jgi:protein-disulfide isomerase
MKFAPWILSAAACVMLAACNNGDKPKSVAAGDVAVKGTALGEMYRGKADAPVTLIEYASITCPHCADFHESVVPALQPRIDSGELKFVFREFPTAPAEVAMAGFAVARCAGEDKYFDVLSDMFKNHSGLMMAARTGTAGDALMTVAERHGLSEAQFKACTRDPVLYGSMVEIIDGGQALGVNATPTLYLNGEKVPNTGYSPDGLNALIDAALGIEPSEPVETEETPEENQAGAGPEAEKTGEAPAPVE